MESRVVLLTAARRGIFTPPGCDCREADVGECVWVCLVNFQRCFCHCTLKLDEGKNKFHVTTY